MDQSSRTLWGSRAEAVVATSLMQSRAQALAQYEQLQRDLHDAMDGEHYSMMVRHLLVTHPRVADRWNAGLGSGHRYLNVTDLVVRTLSVVFHRPPELTLGRSGKALEATDPIAMQWTQDLKDVSFATTLSKWDRWTTLFRTTLLQPCYRTIAGRGQMRWDVHEPYVCSVTQGSEDPSDVAAAAAVHVELPQGVDTRGVVRPLQILTWTPTTCELRQNGGKPMPNPLFEDGINHYGIIPFVCARDGTPASGEFWLPARSPLYRLQTWCNTTLSDEAWGLRYQTHATPVINGWQESESPPNDPGEPIVNKMGDPGTFSFDYKTPTSNIGLAQTALENALRWYAVSEGIPAEIFSGQVATRTLSAMKMAAHYLGLRREEKIPMYREALQRLFTLHKTIGNWHARHTPGSGRVTIPDDVELHVTFAPIPYPVDEVSHSNAVAQAIQLGLSNPVDEIAARDGISREEAEAAYSRNLEINARARPTAPSEPVKPGPDSTQVVPADMRDPEPSPNLPGRPEGS